MPVSNRRRLSQKSGALLMSHHTFAVILTDKQILKETILNMNTVQKLRVLVVVDYAENSVG